MSLFEDIESLLDKDTKSLSTTEEEATHLKKLQKTTEWRMFCNLTERYIVKKLYDMLIGTERDKESAFQELYELRGFTRYWSILKNRVNRKEDEETKEIVE